VTIKKTSAAYKLDNRRHTVADVPELIFEEEKKSSLCCAL
jgi:hypothetical protein